MAMGTTTVCTLAAFTEVVFVVIVKPRNSCPATACHKKAKSVGG
jgi:hypothetical protein